MGELFFPPGIIDGPRRRVVFDSFFFISLLFRRWRCNQIARPIPRISLQPDLRGWIDREEIRCSRFPLRIIATKMAK